ncbi:MAG: alpha/beta fold hydrolase [Deltaproteobacteria bacterium]|nr:alpha/beta fold hydrolase [Deltaproteobacteria bacterium]
MTRQDPPVWPARLTRQAPFNRYVVRVEDVDFHVMEQGAGRTVFALHGNPTWGFLYRKIAFALQGEPLRLVMPDLPGLGFSTKWRDARRHTLGEHGRLMAGLLRALEIRDAVFVLQDWGGAIGALAASQVPGAMAGLVVLNTILSPPREGFRPTTFHKFAKMPIVSDVVFRLFGFPQGYLNGVQGDRRSIDAEAAWAYRYPLRSIRENVAALALSRMVPNSLSHPTIEPLREVETFVRAFHGPSAIVWGERDPVLGRALKRVTGVLPDAPVTMTKAGHFLQEEVPDVIARAIGDLAAKLPAA